MYSSRSISARAPPGEQYARNTPTWQFSTRPAVPVYCLATPAAAGAARQYRGTVGGIALCQVAVTLTYATGRGHALIGRALYLPEGCAADEEHRELAGVPEQVMFATKPQLAGSLIERAHSRGIRAAFVAPVTTTGRCWR